MAGRDDLVDERGPVVWPLHLQYVDQSHVQLVEERALLADAFFAVRTLDDEVYDEVADACNAPLVCAPKLPLADERTLTLVPWQNLPARQNDIVKDLKTDICGLSQLLLVTYKSCDHIHLVCG